MNHRHEIESNPLCPACSRLLNAASAVDGSRAVPKGDDVTVCAYCASVLQYIDRDGVLTLRKVSEEQFSELPEKVREELARARAAIFFATAVMQQNPN